MSVVYKLRSWPARQTLIVTSVVNEETAMGVVVLVAVTPISLLIYFSLYMFICVCYKDPSCSLRRLHTRAIVSLTAA